MALVPQKSGLQSKMDELPADPKTPSVAADEGGASEESAWLAFECEVAPAEAGQRVDQVAARAFSDYSRALLGRWLKSGELTLDGRQVPPKVKVKGGERLRLRARSPAQENWHSPQQVPFEVVYEDAELLVINKPVGLVVHPGAGNLDGTLVNGLLHYRPQLAQLPRAGIVHRLDKDTSGLLLVAGSLTAHTALVRALQAREIHRHYEALVEGVLERGQVVRAAIGRDPAQPTRQRISATGKEAVTHVQVLSKFRRHTHISAQLETGRTHQIRVHLASLGHPLVGDGRYGAQGRIPPAMQAEHILQVQGFARQALHARSLQLAHPASGQALTFSSELATDMQALLDILVTDKQIQGSLGA